MRTSSELFTEIACRNDIRRQAGLPLLDMRDTIAEEYQRDRLRAFRQAASRHEADYDRIRADVLRELRQQHGPGFGVSAGGRWAVEIVAEKQFREWMRDRGIVAPEDRQTVRYGGQSD